MANVLVACEYSGTVRDEFAKLGHNAWSCDLLPSETEGQHYQGDIRNLSMENWDLIIAHPTCTYLTNSGVTWLYNKDGSRDEERWRNLDEGAEFFRFFLELDCPRVAIENPIPHKYAIERIGRKYDQIIHPYQFGHTERKATCLWLKGLPKLESTNDVKEEMLLLPKSQQQRLHWLPPSVDRWKLRSKTYTGFAEAMANQWGKLLE